MGERFTDSYIYKHDGDLWVDLQFLSIFLFCSVGFFALSVVSFFFAPNKTVGIIISILIFVIALMPTLKVIKIAIRFKKLKNSFITPIT